MASEEFCIPYPPGKGKAKWSKLYGMNRFYAGVHWSQRKEAADYWHSIVGWAMQRCRKRPFEKPVKVTAWFNTRLDIDNHAIMLKFIIDGMKGRIIADDSRKFVQAVEMRFHDENYILVRIEEME